MEISEKEEQLSCNSIWKLPPELCKNFHDNHLQKPTSILQVCSCILVFKQQWPSACPMCSPEDYLQYIPREKVKRFWFWSKYDGPVNQCSRRKLIKNSIMQNNPNVRHMVIVVFPTCKSCWWNIVYKCGIYLLHTSQEQLNILLLGVAIWICHKIILAKWSHVVLAQC
jgi:hypothetical protein